MALEAELVVGAGGGVLVAKSDAVLGAGGGVLVANSGEVLDSAIRTAVVTGAADELEASVEFAAALLEMLSLSLLGVGVMLDCEVLESAMVEFALVVNAKGAATTVVDNGDTVSLLASVEVPFVLATGVELDVVNAVLDDVLDNVLDENRKSKKEGDVEVEVLEGADVLTVDASAVLKLVVATSVVVPFADAACVSKIVSSTVSVVVAVSTAAGGGGGGGGTEEASDVVDLDSSKLEVCADF